MSKIVNAQNKWRNGETTLSDIKDYFNLST